MLYRSPRPEGITASKGDYVANWIETHCVYTVGHLAGQSVTLMEWQRAFLRYLFAVDPTGETARRWYRWALLGIPKKNGKTEMAGWLGLYFLFGDGEPTAQVACAASADHQAELVFGAAARCAEWSPTLNKVADVYDREIVPKPDAINHAMQSQGWIGAPGTPRLFCFPGSRLVRVTSGTGTNDGPSWHAIICDELHEWEGTKGRKLWTVLTNGIGGRRQPMILQITTAGIPDEDATWFQQYELGMRLVDDPTIDPRYLFWWYGPAKDEQRHYKDLALAEEVNPSWGVTLPDPETYLADQQTKKNESEYKRYFLNQPTESEDVWLPEGAWDQCEQPDLELDPDRPLYVGIDGALKRDSFAIVAYQPQEPPAEVLELIKEFIAQLGASEDLVPETVDVVRAWIWENPLPKQHPRHGDWKLELQGPMNKLRELRAEFPVAAWMDPDTYEEFEGPAYGYDPYTMEFIAQELEDEGLNMIEVPQTDQRMCPASETLYQKIMIKALAHNGDPNYRRQIHGAVQKEKERGWRLARPKGTTRKIDAAIATAMSAYLANQQQEISTGPNIW